MQVVGGVWPVAKILRSKIQTVETVILSSGDNMSNGRNEHAMGRNVSYNNSDEKRRELER
jgi:hypothetical protein